MYVLVLGGLTTATITDAVKQLVFGDLGHQAVYQLDGGSAAVACRLRQLVLGALLVWISCKEKRNTPNNYNNPGINKYIILLSI